MNCRLGVIRRPGEPECIEVGYWLQDLSDQRAGNSSTENIPRAPRFDILKAVLLGLQRECPAVDLSSKDPNTPDIPTASDA